MVYNDHVALKLALEVPMHPNLLFKLLGMLLLLSHHGSLAFASGKQGLKKSRMQSIQIEGRYEVASIHTRKFAKSDSEYKRILFKRISKAKGKTESIYLDTLSAHPALKVGSSFELAAEVDEKVEHKGALEAIQILVQIPQNNGKVPVWLLSLKSKDLDLRGASYLKMHQPDFMIL